MKPTGASLTSGVSGQDSTCKNKRFSNHTDVTSNRAGAE